VEPFRLGDILDQAAFDRVDLLKMDVEGAEGEIFATVSDAALSRIGTALVECHPSAGGKSEIIAERLARSGMRVARSNRLVLAWRE
jgi:hypothetical protein